MKKVAEVLINKDTMLKINIPTIVTIILSTAMMVSSVFAAKINIDLSINSIQENQVRIEEKFDAAIYDLEESDDGIILLQKEDRAVVLEVRTQLSGIQTDLKWIIADLKSD